MSEPGLDAAIATLPRRPTCERPLLARVLLITDGIHLPATSAEPSPERVLLRLATVLASVPPGSIAVQLRNRELAGGALYALAGRLRELTSRYAAPLLINDRIDIALLVGADGVHLPGHGVPVQSARPLVGPTRFICAAAHSLAEARMLVLAGADAITLSPIWPTPSKPARPAKKKASQSTVASDVTPLGPAILAQAMAGLGRPFGVSIFALGGIDSLSRVGECARLGAQVACLRALLSGDGEDDELSARAAAFVAAASSPATSTGE